MVRPISLGPLVQIIMAHSLDDQEKLILRALVRDPRDSDNAIGQKTGVNVRTVSRTRQRVALN